MEPTGGSGQEGALRQAVAVVPSTPTPAAPSHTPSPAMDPVEISSGIPQQEPDATHLGSDAHQVPRAEPDNEVADPEATMVELEQEHRDWESDILAQISDLDDRARKYKERLDELTSTNAGLHEALHNQESGVKAQVDAIARGEPKHSYHLTTRRTVRRYRGGGVACGSHGRA
jgi:hypothetical protein